MRLGPAQLDELLGQVRALIDSFQGPEEYMSAQDPEGDPYALLMVLHRRRVPAGDKEREARDRPGREPNRSE